MGERRNTARVGKTGIALAVGLAIVTSLATALSVAAVATSATASTTPNVGVYVAYADSVRTNPADFPTPWLGSPQTAFDGCGPTTACEYDAGAVRVVNNSTAPITVNAIAVHIDTCTYTGWAPAVLAPGADLIVTQLASGASDGCTGPTPTHMDTSDIGPGGKAYAGNCTPDGIQPVVDVTVDATTTSYVDSGQVINTGGIDYVACGGHTTESIQWTPIGRAPCRGSALTLTPPAQTHGVGTTATLTATYSNGCNLPLSNVAVNVVAQTGPNAGLTRTGVTDASGQSTVTYTSTLVGIDTWLAYIDNPLGRITSNTVTVTWVAFAPGGGAFVIGDLEDASGASVYWWGAQWWKKNPLSTGLAPASFKGYLLDPASPWCGQTWTTRPGNSPHPPKTVPGMMAVIVSSHMVKNGPVISGDIVGIVLVQTNPGYGPNPGHRGTGTIVSTLCSVSHATGASVNNPKSPSAPATVPSISSSSKLHHQPLPEPANVRISPPAPVLVEAASGNSKSHKKQ